MYSLTTYTEPKIVLSSDFSQQEPKILAYVARDKAMCDAFAHGRDIYATIASIAYKVPYEQCLEFNPDTGEYQPEGKARRSEAKTIVLGISYGRSVPSIGEQLYNHRDDMTDDEKTKEAQRIYDSVMKAFPSLKRLMEQSQAFARRHGYTETILGRRRHLPDMQLDEFEFKPLPGYVNPNVDPLDLSTLDNEEGIPESQVKALQQEFSKYKYFGQIAKRTKQLYEKDHIKVINNRPKINDARRQCVNCVDAETEILTVDGWKTYDQISVGDEIYTYSLDRDQIEKDSILEIHKDSRDLPEIEVWHLYNATFDARCTENHRWVMRQDGIKERSYRFYDTAHILKVKQPRYQILRVSKFFDDANLSVLDDEKAKKFAEDIYNDCVTYEDIFNLNRESAFKVYDILRAKANITHIDLRNKSAADKIQVLALVANRVCNVYKRSRKSGDLWEVSCPKKDQYRVAQIKSLKKAKEYVNFVWCVTTKNGTWIARRNGKPYITGNSIIQGSAADFTKMALLKVTSDPRWEECQGEILTIVHDEIIAQVPESKLELGARTLKEDMESAGSFLPFPIKCDVTISYRWYGLEIPCKFHKPDSLNDMSADSLSWVQWHLVDLGYELPAFKNDDGSDPIGDASKGVSGKDSKELHEAISKYCDRYSIVESEFLDDIEARVETGYVERNAA